MPAHRRPTSRHSSPYQVDRVTNTRCTRDRRRVSYRAMDSFRIDEIARRLLERVPPALRSMQQDLESNFRAVLRERLSKLDLVSRDEFDAQTRVLERTRSAARSTRGAARGPGGQRLRRRQRAGSAGLALRPPRTAHRLPWLWLGSPARAQVGLHAPLVHVEVSLASGLPVFCIVGLPATVVKESKERVRAALLNSHFEFPAGRINGESRARGSAQGRAGRFRPADRARNSAGIRPDSRASRHLPDLRGREFYGELGLTGELKPVRGLLLAAAHAARHGHELVVPRATAAEAWRRGTGAGARRGSPARGVCAPHRRCATVALPAAAARRRRRPRRSVLLIWPTCAGSCRPACAHHRSGRRAQPPHDRSARIGQEHAGAESAGTPAAPDACRGAGGGRGRRGELRGLHAAMPRGAAVPRPASTSHRLGGSAGGGAAPARVPGRSASRITGVLFLDELPEVRAGGAGGAARARSRPASWPCRGPHCRPSTPGVSAHCRDEPMSVRAARRSGGRVPLQHRPRCAAIAAAFPLPCSTGWTCTSRCRAWRLPSSRPPRVQGQPRSPPPAASPARAPCNSPPAAVQCATHGCGGAALGAPWIEAGKRATRGGNATVGTLGPGAPAGTETGAHHCRSRRRPGHQRRTSGRGGAVALPGSRRRRYCAICTM